MAEICGKMWWAWQGLNLRPLRCQHTGYRCNPQKTAILAFRSQGTSGEHAVNLARIYRTVTAHAGRAA